MKIQRIKIENYRLLKNISIDLEEIMSLVIGKNNTGKTSLLTVLNRFLNGSEKNKFSFDDFNIDFKNELKNLIESPKIDEKYQPKGIKLKLFIEYNEKDNLANVSRVMMDLDPENRFIVLSFEYVLDYDALENLKDSFKDFLKRETVKLKSNSKYLKKDIFFFLKKYQVDYFKSIRKSLEYNFETGIENDLVFIDLDKEKISIKEIINFKFIPAKRSVTNKETDKTLSAQTSKI